MADLAVIHAAHLHGECPATPRRGNGDSTGLVSAVGDDVSKLIGPSTKVMMRTARGCCLG